MAASPAQINADRTLASVLAERGTLAAGPALALIRSLAAQLGDLHVAGMIHGSIYPETILWNDQDAPRLETAAPGTVLKFDDDWAGLFPELSRLERLPLPVTVDAARQLFQDAGIRLDPRKIDLCQLGALWCRVLTGESAGAYLRSPRVKGIVPPGLRAVLERALGANGREAFTDARELGVALEAVAAEFGPPLTIRGSAEPLADGIPEVAPVPSAHPSTGDTTPSSISSANQPTDTTIAPGQSAAAHGAPAGRHSALDHDGSTDTADNALPFTRLGQYEILRRIGRGGMGDVYLGYEPALDRNVAIKVLPADMARSADFVRRFRTEATAVARLNHPNIVPIHSIGEDQGHHFYVMQFVEGESLADRLSRQERLGVVETLQIVEQALAGLAAAHDHGMVHRDIKPGNILLDSRSGRALLADFGLVKSLGSSASGKTATGVVMGTVDYISPEQGRGLAVDARSDLYSIGVLLYRILSGRLPFLADNPTALIFQHVYETPPALAQVAPHVPVAMAAVIEKLLAKSPADRHQTADELLADLRALRSGQPAPSQAGAARHSPTTIIRLPTFDEEPPDTPEELPAVQSPAWWEQTRDRALSMFRRNAPEVLLQLQNTQQQIDGAVAVYERRQRDIEHLARDAESVLVDLQKQSREQRAAAAAAGQRAQSATSVGDAAQAHEDEENCLRAAAELDHQVAEQQEQFDLIGLRLAQVQAKAQELRNQRDILQARLKVAGARGFVAAGSARRRRNPYLGVAAASVFCALAVAYLVHELKVRNSLIASRAANQEAAEPGTGAALPAEKDRNDVPEHLRLRARIPLRQFSGHENKASSVAFHPQGKMLASVGEDKTIRLWKTDTGEQIKVFESDVSSSGQKFTSVTFSPNGRYIAAATNSAARQELLILWDWESNSVPLALPAGNGWIPSFAFSPDGEQLAMISYQNKVLLLNVADMSVVRSLDVGFAAERVAFSPVDRILACGAFQGTVQLWEPDQLKPRQVLEGCTKRIHALAFSRDGSLLGGCDEAGHIVVWDVKSGAVVSSLDLAKDPARALAFSNDGRLVYFVCSQGVRLWDRKMNRIRGTFNSQKYVTDLALSPDGTLMASSGTDPSLVLWDARPEPVLLGTNAGRATEVPAMLVAAAARSSRFLAATRKVVGYFDYANTENYHKLADDIGLIQTIGISNDGRYAVAGTFEGVVCLWDLTLGRETRRMNIIANVVADRSNVERDLNVRSVSFTPDRRHVLVTTSQTMFLWDIQTGEEIYRFSAAPEKTTVAAVSPDGKFVVTGGLNRIEKMGDLRLWDLATGEYVQRFVGHVGEVTSLAFSPDSRQLLTGGTGFTHLWDVTSANQVQRFKTALGGAIYGVAFSPDGSHIAAASSYTIGVWDLASFDEQLRVAFYGNHSLNPGTIAFTADGRFIAGCDGEQQLRLWDIQVVNPRSEP